MDLVRGKYVKHGHFYDYHGETWFDHDNIHMVKQTM